MLFSSPVFLFLFLPLLLGSYFVLPRQARNWLLLLLSLLFYSWGEGLFVLILLTSITFNFVLGLWIDRLHGQRAATLVLILTVAGNLGLLGAFKYANFLVENLNLLLAVFQLAPMRPPAVHLPLGISFFTFHALSYVVDVYRREMPPLTRPVPFALYISFFPQSIAGPIVRYRDVQTQLENRVVSLDGFAEGVRRFILGLAKKVLIANTVAVAADGVFKLGPAELTPTLAWLGVVCYTLQIYFDFSGYSDMAIGLARMFGFQFRENFNHPYAASSVTDFWRRWHISLSSWFRDYLYIPMGGNRCGKVRLCANLLTVFLLCGLWHGASWTFVLWGLFHGSFLAMERLGLGRWLEKGTWPVVRHVYALLVVMIGWVFFRADSMSGALAMLAAMMGVTQGAGVALATAPFLSRELIICMIAGMMTALPTLPFLAGMRDRFLAGLATHRLAGPIVEAVIAMVPVAALMLLLLASSMHLAAGTYNPFIYFRF